MRAHLDNVNVRLGFVNSVGSGETESSVFRGTLAVRDVLLMATRAELICGTAKSDLGCPFPGVRSARS